MLKTLSLAAVFTAGLFLPLGAQAADPNPAKVPAGTYVVEPRHTQVQFAVSHMGFTTFHGDFTKVSGTLKLDPKTLSASTLEVTVPVDTVVTVNDNLTDELKSVDWLDAAKFPTATFKATKFKKLGKGKAEVAGVFTLHGITKPIVFMVHFNGAGKNPRDKNYTIGFDATAKIKRSDFGVKTYLPQIGDEVTLLISAAFEKQN